MDAKMTLAACYETLEDPLLNKQIKWMDVRDIAKEFIDSLPAGVLEVIELYQKALEHLKEYQD